MTKTKKETELQLKQVQVFIDPYMPSEKEAKEFNDFIKNNQAILRELAKHSLFQEFQEIEMIPFG